MKKAIVLGTFDLPHYGHFRLFKRIKESGYYLIVAITTDEFAKSYKREPLLDLNERLETISHCKWVDKTIINLGGHKSKKDIIFSEADIILHGDDWKGDSYFKQIGIDHEWLDKNNIKVDYLPYTKGISTTEIIRRSKKWKQSDTQ